MTKRPPHVSYYRDRHGVMRWRFRKAGLPESQTRALFNSTEWIEWYQGALSGARVQIGHDRTKPGTMSALIVDYYTTAKWVQLAPNTRTTYRGILERLRAEHGHRMVADLTSDRIERLLDEKANTPAAANNLLRMFRILMPLAIKRGMIKTNPAATVEPLKIKSDGFHTWTEAEIEKFETQWLVGTRERLAFDLLLYTAQRSGDVRRMGPQHVKGGYLTVKQEKTGAELELPVLAPLAASLAAYRSGHLTFLTTQHGKPYTAKGFGNWFSDAAQKAGLPVGCAAHGLRKAAATRLANAGASSSQIMAWTGHKTLKEVARYIRDADQKRGATASGGGLASPKQEHTPSNPPERLANGGGK